ncbi:fibronectin type III domain-containing protein [Dactylosporangium vinaceum]|uniref:Fibronectin type III domain-containing protein n=1 Tax=Dactylosporangium vinaceum TaxID=53362 RepID=A0ABV5M7E3_9ACTN|nr:fibronectin type III domain-containing protein [Dactylosporangium vinaceum]UAB95328.1 fibronectin type III domain-containing protein [Dactylosporangium vinaceum]
MAPSTSATAAPPPVAVITRIAGNASGTTGSAVAGPALSSPLNYPYEIGRDGAGNLYFVDYGSKRAYKIDAAGTMTIVAGDGTTGAIVPGVATGSPFQALQGLAVDSTGNVYLADPASRRVVKIDQAGQLSYFAGNGSNGAVVPGPATSTPVPIPYALTTDTAGNVYIVNSTPKNVYKVTPGGVLSIVAGTGGTGPNVPGPATSSPMSPNNVATDGAGNLYIADTTSCDVLKVTPGGTLSIFAGNNSCSGTITDGAATATTLRHANGLAADSVGNVYVSNWDTGQISKITPAGQLTVIAGTGTYGLPTYNGPALASSMRQSEGLAVNDAGVVFAAHSDNNTIDRIGPATPSAPRDVQAAVSGTTLTVSFEPPVDAGTTPITGYEVSLDAGATWTTLATTAAGGRRTGNVSGVTAGTAYQVQVRAVNGSGASDAGAGSAVPTAPVAAAPGGGLAVTGDATSTTVGIGVLLLVAGLGLRRLVGRRRAGH